VIFFSSSLSCVCVRARSTLVVVVNTSGRLPVVALPPATPAPPHGQDGVSVHSGSGEREGRRRNGGGRCGHLRGGRQPPLVLKPATTRSGLIYRAERERETDGQRDQRKESDREWRKRKERFVRQGKKNLMGWVGGGFRHRMIDGGNLMKVGDS